MQRDDVYGHVRGESLFLDDITEPQQTLFAAVVQAVSAHARLVAVDGAPALALEGVQAVITARDVPGENQIGAIFPDEPILADDEVHWYGQPVALVVACDREIARKAAKLVQVTLEELPVITDPREAYAKGQLIASPRTFALGDTNEVWNSCDIIVEGRADSGAQEHFYLETQGALAIPEEGDRLRIIASTQSPTGVQRGVVRVLGLQQHQIEVDVLRLGGGFGGKEDQATLWASLAALAAWKLKRPVKLVLDRREDMVMTGKRHPYSSDFKLGLTRDGLILAYEVMFYQNSGAEADLSTSILERTLFHTTGSYYIPNVKATAVPCRTNLVPFTAFRGFGGPQAMFVLECAIAQAAEKLQLHPSVIQRRNLLTEKSLFPYGQKAQHAQAEACWDTAVRQYRLDTLLAGIDRFNAENCHIKKGLALMPVCFGISFTTTPLNQASALVHVYTDGSVSVSTAAVEMGQGVNRKISLIVSRVFGIPVEKVRVESTNTSRVANTSPTAASSGADLNGKAAEIAAKNILDQLLAVAAELLGLGVAAGLYFENSELRGPGGKRLDLTWEGAVSRCYAMRRSLSSHAFFATPGIHFDKTKEKGTPFAYHVYGTAVIEASVDLKRAIYTIDSVRIVHDCGKSIDERTDRGQIEGALMQGIGWMTCEELSWTSQGRPLADSAAKYKIPDMHAVPPHIEIALLEHTENPLAVAGSKAVGEPPFMYGIGAYFALCDALKHAGIMLPEYFKAPLTPQQLCTILDTAGVY